MAPHEKRIASRCLWKFFHKRYSHESTDRVTVFLAKNERTPNQNEITSLSKSRDEHPPLEGSFVCFRKRLTVYQKRTHPRYGENGKESMGLESEVLSHIAT